MIVPNGRNIHTSYIHIEDFCANTHVPTLEESLLKRVYEWDFKMEKLNLNLKLLN